MNETRRTKDWITPEILEKSHQQHLMVSREAIETSDNVGVPIAEPESILSTLVPDVKDIASLSDLLDKKFFKLFFIGIAISGVLGLCTIGTQGFHSANKTDWNSLAHAAHSLTLTKHYDEAEMCFKSALALPYIDSAEKSAIYSGLSDLARRKGDQSAEREYMLKEKEFNQVGFGLASIVLAAILLFITGISSIFMFRSEKSNVPIGWQHPTVVALATFAFSNGLHNIAPSIPWLVLTFVASSISLIVLILSAACDGSRHSHFVTPSR